MARPNIEGGEAKDLIMNNVKTRLTVYPGTAAVTLPSAVTSLVRLTPTATRVVTLPAVADCEGCSITIMNTAATGSGFNLTVNNAGATTIGTVAPMKNGTFVCDGANWTASLTT